MKRMKSKDFSQLKYFPGDVGNPFDVFLHSLEKIEKLPSILFGLLLIILAVCFSNWNTTRGMILVMFFFIDWVLLALLPVYNISFGPSKPPALTLVLLRCFFSIFPLTFTPWVGLQLLGTALVIYGFWIEPHHIRVTFQTLKVKGFYAPRPLRLLHIGDLHIERISKREIELNRLIKNLKPDIILFSGDILNLSYLRDETAIRDARQIISEWEAPLGVFLVAGSPAVDLPETIPGLLDGIPVHFLDNKMLHINFHEKVINLIGLQSTQRPHIEAPILKSLLENEKNENLNILLYHSPDIAPEAAALGIDLQLSGHTHAGQVRLPVFGALLTGSLYGKRFEAGRIQVEDMTLYVTRGIGMEGGGAPRVRFLCPPEIILWEIS